MTDKQIIVSFDYSLSHERNTLRDCKYDSLEVGFDSNVCQCSDGGGFSLSTNSVHTRVASSSYKFIFASSPI